MVKDVWVWWFPRAPNRCKHSGWFLQCRLGPHKNIFTWWTATLTKNAQHPKHDSDLTQQIWSTGTLHNRMHIALLTQSLYVWHTAYTKPCHVGFVQCCGKSSDQFYHVIIGRNYFTTRLWVSMRRIPRATPRLKTNNTAHQPAPKRNRATTGPQALSAPWSLSTAVCRTVCLTFP